MRGKVVLNGDLFKVIRITPAHAGKSIFLFRMGSGVQDHPRTCGEKRAKPLVRCNLLGSPPHMRGKDFSILSVQEAIRITPAHAGKRRYFSH